MRSDTRRNISSLLAAVGEEIEVNAQGVTLQSVAARAGVAKATAYRYFSSLDELTTAYTVQSMQQMRQFSTESTLKGEELFRSVLGQWVAMVFDHGHVMVQLRSRKGYLDRFDHGDPVIDVSREIWERPMSELLSEKGLSQSLLRHALFLCNIFVDPREVLDLRNSESMTAEQIVSDLDSTIHGAVVGWQQPSPRNGGPKW
ncbi:TetR/AcrR family transcriptional regulator [Paenarthrobacter nitroguajacolicus]|uniref:TetR/AcrR family transcriptional regulator n=1 Tax=Paenarthrobacter nitroguajacolicus TaxID=211146 RepID=UPI00248B2712|nr:TetR/AcrR family transcriptional regulator [Paenarthrobacter nitroguajacolicus]MDI2037290.1 hypothetical protein [Paenarthrobacter nitroguajacolicus]